MRLCKSPAQTPSVAVELIFDATTLGCERMNVISFTPRNTELIQEAIRHGEEDGGGEEGAIDRSFGSLLESIDDNASDASSGHNSDSESDGRELKLLDSVDDREISGDLDLDTGEEFGAADEFDAVSRRHTHTLLGFNLSDVIHAINGIKPTGDTLKYLHGITPHQIKRMACFRLPLQMFNLEVYRMFPTREPPTTRPEDYKYKTRILPLHMVPLFLVAQKPRVHRANPTVPACLNLLDKMRTVKLHCPRDNLLRDTIHQFEANLKRAMFFMEFRADLIKNFVAHTNTLEAILHGHRAQLDRAAELTTELCATNTKLTQRLEKARTHIRRSKAKKRARKDISLRDNVASDTASPPTKRQTLAHPEKE